MPRGLTRPMVAGAIAAAMAIAVLPIDRPEVAAAPHPDVTAELNAAAAKLVETSTLPPLVEVVPGLATNPAELLSLHTPFAKLATLPTNADLDTAIEALSGDGFTFDNINVDTGGDATTVSFDLSADRTIPVELGFVEDDVQLLGGSIDVGVTMPATTITVEYDSDIGGGDEFALTQLPRLDLTLRIDEALDEQVQFGFATATAGGTFDLDSTIALQLTDPDGSGRLTLPEMTSAAIEDLVAVSFSEDAGSNELDATIELTADVSGTAFTGTVNLSDARLFEGDPVDVGIDLEGPNPIAMLTNIGPDTALSGLSQVLSGFGAGMIAGDRSLPFLDGGVLIPAGLEDDFDKVFDAVKPLYDYVQSRSVQLNCGAFPIGAAPAESDEVPLFPVTDLEAGQLVACRGYAGEDRKPGTPVMWNPTGATVVTSDSTALGNSVGIEPTSSVIFEMAGAGDFAATLTFTPRDTGVATTVQQRPATVQQLIQELEDAGALPADAVRWNGDLQALMFDLSFTSPALTRQASVDAGNALAADTHLTGLSSTAKASMDVGPLAADLSVGMILTDDPNDITSGGPPSPAGSTESKRFIIEVPSSGTILSVDDVALDTSVGFDGRLGFLEVDGDAQLTSSKEVGTDPALAVQLQNPTGVTVGAGPTVPDAMLIGDLLTDPLAYLGVDANLTVDGQVALEADALAASGSAGFDLSWPLGGAPTVSNVSAAFDTLIDFDRAETLTVNAANTAATGDALAPGSPVEVTVETTATNLTTLPGFVGAILTRDGQPDCQITAISSDSAVNCTLTVPAGHNAADPLLENGEYTVVGNTLSHLAEILDAIEQFATLLQQSVDVAQLGEDVELWGIRPSDLATQAEELQLLVDEFRGVADAVIECTPPAGAELRGLPTAPGGNNTIQCHAANGNTAANDVRWRVVKTADGSGDWVNGAGTTVGQGSATRALTVPDGFDTNGDGFLALGTEWSVVVEWTDQQGDHRASLPPATPGSLTRLEQLVERTLGLPDPALAFRLDTTTQPGTPMLAIDLGYGICSPTAPSGADCTGMPTGPAPDVSVALDLGDQTLAGLSTQGDIAVQYAALGRFNVGVPLDGSTPVVLPDTGLDLTALVDSDDFGLEANIGPFAASAGSTVDAPTGTALAGSGDGTLVVSPAKADEIPDDVTVVRDGDEASCVVTAHGAADGDGNIPLTCSGVEWAKDDTFTALANGVLKGQLGVELSVDEGPIDTADVDAQFTGLDDDCGALPSGDTVVGPAPAGDTLACTRLALAVKSGSNQQFLGELGADLVNVDDGDPLTFDLQPTVVVPSDLASQLLSAVLDPSLILQALPRLLEDIENQLRSLAGTVPSAVGDPLRAAADGLEEVRLTLGPALELAGDLSTAGGIESALQTKLEEVLGDFLPDGTTLTVTTMCAGSECGDGDGAALVDDISVDVEFGGEIAATAAVNLGLEGLPLQVQGGVNAGAEWSLTTGLGVSRDDGPYLNAPSGEVRAFVELDGSGATCAGIEPESVPDGTYTTDRCITARLGFLDLEAMDAAADDERTKIDATATLAVSGGGDDRITFDELVAGDVDVDADIGGDLNINLALRTGIAGTGADLPSIVGTLQFGAAASASGGFEPPTFAFGDLHLDVGTYLAEFLGPVIDGINDVISPFMPVIDVLTAPIPVVSDLAALVGEPPVTMISLLEAASGANLEMIKAILAIVEFVDTIDDVVGNLGDQATDGSLQLPLGELLGGAGALANGFPDRQAGSFEVDVSAAGKSVSPTEAGSLIKSDTVQGGSGFVNDIAGTSGDLQPTGNSSSGRPTTFGVPGLSFPVLDDASQLFGLLVGRDAVLIRWDAGTMEAAAGMSWDFGPIMVGPVPITITIGGEIGVRGRFAIGYDTVGIRKLIDGAGPVALLDGIFIDDLDANGNDVAEVEFFGRVYAGAAVDLVIVSAGVKGGIELTFGLNLNDSPDPDGKLRIDEILDKLANPICLFDVEGRIEAFLAAFVKIDLFFVSKEYSFELVRVTLLEWSSSCEPPEPDLATPDGGVLYLNAGSRAPTRNVAVEDADEQIEVRQLGPGRVRVSGYGTEEVVDGVQLIVADAGSGDDELLFLPGGEEGGDPIPFTIPVVASGGGGSDIVKMGGEADASGGADGGAPDLVFGDTSLQSSGVTEWAGVSFTPPGPKTSADDEAFDDTIETGAGGDAVQGNQGKDRLSGGLGVDSLQGGGGADRIVGGPRDDVILGDGGDDTLSGGPSEPDAADDDVIVGGSGTDTVTGDVGNDVLFGDDTPGGLVSGSTTLSFTGDSADWAGWCTAGGAPDLMTGNDGDDVLIGGAGGDQLAGNAGNDRAKGCAGDDLIDGDAGDDNLHGDDDRDTIGGGVGNDIARGGSDNDVANGDAGTDIVFGDAGSDRLGGDDGADIVVGDTGSVTDPSFGVATDGAPDIDKAVTMAASVDHSHGGDGQRRVDCDQANAVGDSDCVFGGGGSDALFGTGAGDIMRGEAGVDLMVGGDGDDLMRGGVDRDVLFGSAGADEAFGESNDDVVFGDRAVADWPTDTPAGAGNDQLFGGPGADRAEGDGGDDLALGGADDDHLEGNDGADTVLGESADDNVIGGSDAAGEADAGDTLLSGGVGRDVIAGDNAVLTGHAGGAGFVVGRDVQLLDSGIGGADHVEGDADPDAVFAGPGDDAVWGDQGPTGPFLGSGDADYVEGNDGDDEIHGETGTDDLAGGGSAADGTIDAGRDGNGLADSGETLISGGDGVDWIAGDNARMNRVLGGGPDYPSAGVDPIVLFDVARIGGPAVDPASTGDDALQGDAASDYVFGQGGDDTLSGGDAGDYVEGNDGDDAIAGDAGADDLVGGGSADDGIIVADRIGNTLYDGGETLISGGDGVDWIAGDNTLMNRALFDDAAAPVTLFDVNSTDAAVSGGDTINGDGADDRVWGQGNGAQDPAQSDPSDGLDNDGDNTVDEDGAAWAGDTIAGGDGDDEIEGNHGGDFVDGGPGLDDIAGGGSAIDGVIDADRIGDGLLDARDTLHGGDGDDVAGGDNVRIVPAESGPYWLTSARHALLFDVNDLTPALSGGDFVAGGPGADVMFGQGNGQQPGDQADPLDGYDNDLDGREGAGSQVYDCGDGTDNDADGVGDGADPDCAAAVDEDQPWDGDIMFGGDGIDYAEGNHGADLIMGENGQDILIGGGSAIDGSIDDDRESAGLADGPDVIRGAGDHDAAIGDNAVVSPVAAEGEWAFIPGASAGGPFDLLERTVMMTTTPDAAGNFGHDHLLGGDDHDGLYGQQGDDLIEAEAGDDGVVGDLGTMSMRLEDGSRQRHVAPRQPFVEDDIFVGGTLTRLTTLHSQVTGDGAEGDDVVLGGQGHDDLHGGPGDDIANGDRYSPPPAPDPNLIELIPGQFTFDNQADPFPDEDAVFGGWGDDTLWGGRDPDHVFGGHGEDFLDVRPRPADGPHPADPPTWFTWAGLGDQEEHYQDSDFLYGGWDADILQANLAEPGPHDGDRLLDWAGAFNAYYVCPGAYGDWTITRSIAPGLLEYVNDVAAGDGLVDVASPGSSGYLELGLVYRKDVKNNANPPHPLNPAHFYCGPIADE